MMNTLAVILVAAALAKSDPLPVVEMGTRVTGNQEQPRVLYIVPWQPADGPDSLYRDLSSQIDDLLEPVEREAFQRELQLRRQLPESGNNALR